MKNALQTITLGLLTLLLVVSCGEDDGAVGERPVDDGPVDTGHGHGHGHGAAAATGDERTNETWDTVKGHFLGLENDPSTGFVRQTMSNLRDPFEPMLVKFVPRIILPETEQDPSLPVAEEISPETVENIPQPVAQGETQKFRAQDYRVVLIRWGTSLNKAIVEDPEGGTFVVTEDMKLGNNNGRIVGITRYDVTVREDNREEPIILSIRPPILRIQDVDKASERLFTNQTPSGV